MIRRDYILEMIERFAQMLARIRADIAGGRPAEASDTLDHAFQELVGAGPDAVSRLSETELLALILRDDPAQVARQKTLVLVALLNEAGNLRASAEPPRTDDARACWIKALDLLLEFHLQDIDLEFPEFVPKIEILRQQLADAPLPLRTLAALWRIYERNGAYAAAEDALYDLIEAQPANADLHAEAVAFYDRLLQQSDAALQAGNLPRPEVEAALSQLRSIAPASQT
jgi:hypothetical protein